MAVALLTDEQLQALLERALQPLRDELAKLRAAVEAEGVSVPEAARRLGVSERTVKRRIRDGTLPSLRFGGARRVLLGEVLRTPAPLGLADRDRER